jgi:hypothetical protein
MFNAWGASVGEPTGAGADAAGLACLSIRYIKYPPNSVPLNALAPAIAMTTQMVKILYLKLILQF